MDRSTLVRAGSKVCVRLSPAGARVPSSLQCWPERVSRSAPPSSHSRSCMVYDVWAFSVLLLTLLWFSNVKYSRRASSFTTLIIVVRLWFVTDRLLRLYPHAVQPTPLCPARHEGLLPHLLTSQSKLPSWPAGPLLYLGPSGSRFSAHSQSTSQATRCARW